jgi:hypothetical protein
MSWQKDIIVLSIHEMKKKLFIICIPSTIISKKRNSMKVKSIYTVRFLPNVPPGFIK